MVGGMGVESCFCWSEAGMVIRVKCVGNGQCQYYCLVIEPADMKSVKGNFEMTQSRQQRICI